MGFLGLNARALGAQKGLEGLKKRCYPLPLRRMLDPTPEKPKLVADTPGQVTSGGVFQNADLADLNLPVRKNPSLDPAGYALETLESSLRSRGIDTRTLLKAPELALLELGPALGGLPKQGERLTVLRELLEHIGTSESYCTYLCNKLPHLLGFISTKERGSLLRYALAMSDRRVKASLAFAIVRSARTSGELKSLISERRAVELSKLKHVELRELVAKAVFCRQFGKQTFPRGLGRSATARVVQDPRGSAERVRERLREMYSSLKKHLAVIEAYPELSSCRTTREFKRSLSEAIETLSPHVPKGEGAPRHRLSRYQGGQLVNLLAKKVRLELEYGIHLARGSGVASGETRPWSVRDIRNVRAALSLIPAGHLIMTPLLHRFEKFPSKDSFGLRRDSGAIAIADDMSSDRSYSREFGGVQGLVVTLVHEIGHALQVGKADRDIKFNRETGEILNPADPLFDFGAFLALSNWRVITEQPQQWIYNGEAIRIGTSEYPLNHPAAYKGEYVVLTTYEDTVTIKKVGEPNKERPIKLVLAHSAGAGFGIRPYGREDPFEDWAEGFSEYILAPERFSRLAPEKFLFYHVHFRCYEESSAVIQDLYRRLS